MPMSESPVICFVEGFKFGQTVKNLHKHIDTLHKFEEKATATPLDIEIVKDMEKNIDRHLKTLREASCISEELRNLITYETLTIQRLVKDKEYEAAKNRVQALEDTLSRWI